MAHPAADHAHAPAGHAGDHAEHHGSFMPLILTVGVTLLLMGAKWHVLAIPGFLILVGAVWGWIREDVHELRGKPFQVHGSDYLFGAIVLILSEVVIFGVLFTFYFWSHAHQGEAFIPKAVEEMDLTPIVINTVLLVSSGVTVEIAKARMKRDDMRGFRIWLGLTILLGALFVAGQVREYLNLISEGVTIQGSIYGTSFYSLTGVHGLHVVAGLVALSILLYLSFTGFIVKERLSGMEGAFLYWHFVDGIWILVFLIIYLRVVG